MIVEDEVGCGGVELGLGVEEVLMTLYLENLQTCIDLMGSVMADESARQSRHCSHAASAPSAPSAASLSGFSEISDVFQRSSPHSAMVDTAGLGSCESLRLREVKSSR
jgi:hypothetical protein